MCLLLVARLCCSWKALSCGCPAIWQKSNLRNNWLQCRMWRFGEVSGMGSAVSWVCRVFFGHGDGSGAWILSLPPCAALSDSFTNACHLLVEIQVFVLVIANETSLVSLSPNQSLGSQHQSRRHDSLTSQRYRVRRRWMRCCSARTVFWPIPLWLGELWLGQGFYEGLDRCLHEVVVLGLIICVEVGFVIRFHLLVGGVHSVTGTAGDWRAEKLGVNEELKMEE